MPYKRKSYGRGFGRGALSMRRRNGYRAGSGFNRAIRWGRNAVDWGYKAYKLASYVKGLVNVEYKNVDISNAPTVSSTPAVV